jgi:hypothetical protein
VQFESPTEAELLSKRDCGQSVAELESLTDSKSFNGHMPYPPEIQRRLSNSLDSQPRYSYWSPIPLS